jgi:alpha-beta hydrolase superfamily lysophospholipase
MQHRELGWVSEDGLDLYAQAWEPDTDLRAVVCLVHGIGEHSGRYGYVASRLTGAGFALLCCDLRGHGRSSGQRGHSPSYAHLMQDIDTLLEQASAKYPGKPRFLYGHSMGGGLVLNYALRCKPDIAGVIATSPWLRLTTPAPAWKLSFGKVMYYLFPRFSMPTGLDQAALAHDPAVIKAYAADPLVHEQVSARLAIDMFSAGEYALAHAGELSLPLLLVHGSADQITSPEATRQLAASAPAGRVTLRILDGCFHETHNEPEKEQVTQLLIDWLSAQVPVIPSPSPA